jgi:hypothetical protein
MPLKAYLGTRAKQYPDTPTHTTTHRNNNVNIDEIKYIFIVFPTKSVFKH